MKQEEMAEDSTGEQQSLSINQLGAAFQSINLGRLSSSLLDGMRLMSGDAKCGGSRPCPGFQSEILAHPSSLETSAHSECTRGKRGGVKILGRGGGWRKSKQAR